MTASRGLFVRQTGTAPNAVGTTPLEGRLALAALVAELSPGVPRNGLLFQSAAQVVTPSTTDMSYNITACNPVINRATNEGVYLFSLTGTTNVALDNTGATLAAPGTGSRYDLVYVKQDDPDKGDPDNLPIVGVVKGASSTGTPTKPYASVPAGGYVIAEELVVSGTTAMSGTGNVCTQVWVHTATRGAPIPVRNLTERNALTGFPGLRAERLDLGGVIDVYIGSAWVLGDTGWAAPTVFGNGFTAYTGSGYDGVKYRLLNGQVHVSGAAVNAGSWAAGVAVCALPAGFIPTRKIVGVNCVVDTTGNVLTTTTGTNTTTTFYAQFPLG